MSLFRRPNGLAYGNGHGFVHFFLQILKSRQSYIFLVLSDVL